MNEAYLAPRAARAVTVAAATVAALLTPEVAAEARVVGPSHATRAHHVSKHAKRKKHARRKKHHRHAMNAKASPAASSAPATRSTRSCTTSAGYEEATAGPFEQHFYAAHLERSPAEQVQDASDASNYAQVHTALVEAMIAPTLSAGDEATVVLQQSLGAFVAHVYSAHLEQAPAQQIAALMDPNTYALSHTVLVEQMIKPVLDWVQEMMAGKTTCTTTQEPASSSSSAPAPAKAIDISGHMFMPQDLSVPAGTPVTWTNDDSEPHDVDADGGSFKSSTLKKGESYSYTFSSPGTFTYYCSIHPDMKGKVTVG